MVAKEKEFVHGLAVKYYGDQPKTKDPVMVQMKRFDTGMSRNEMMLEAKARGIKNFRILNKEELIKVLEMKKSGATDEQIKEQVVDTAIIRWKKGWKTTVVTAMILLFSVPAMAETASWYSRESCIKESGQCTMANGKELDDEAYTCAIWDKKFGTRIKVTNIENGLSVIVKVTDRGPAKRLVRKGRIIDLSKAAFRAIADLKLGIIQIKVEVI